MNPTQRERIIPIAARVDARWPNPPLEADDPRITSLWGIPYLPLLTPVPDTPRLKYIQRVLISTAGDLTMWWSQGPTYQDALVIGVVDTARSPIGDGTNGLFSMEQAFLAGTVVTTIDHATSIMGWMPHLYEIITPIPYRVGRNLPPVIPELSWSGSDRVDEPETRRRNEIFLVRPLNRLSKYQLMRRENFSLWVGTPDLLDFVRVNDDEDPRLTLHRTIKIHAQNLAELCTCGCLICQFVVHPSGVPGMPGEVLGDPDVDTPDLEDDQED